MGLGWEDGFPAAITAPTPRRGSPAKQCRYLHFKASLGSQEAAGTVHAGKQRQPLAKASPSSSLLPGCWEEQDAPWLSCNPAASFKPCFFIYFYHYFFFSLWSPCLVAELCCLHGKRAGCLARDCSSLGQRAPIPAGGCRCRSEALALLRLCPWQLFALFGQDRARGVQAGAFFPARCQGRLCVSPAQAGSSLAVAGLSSRCPAVSWLWWLCKVPTVLLAPWET